MEIKLLEKHLSLAFKKFYWAKGVLPDAPNPPETDRVSSYLFVNLHKTVNKW